jgi:hypothetical protein
MEKTFQPFIIKKAEEVLDDLKGLISPNEKSKKHLCELMTEKFIEGKLSEDDDYVFESDDEINEFLNLCKVYDDIAVLQEYGLVGTYDDDEECYFVTEKGKQYLDKQ